VKRIVPFVVLIVLVIGLLVTPFVLFRPDRYKQTLIDHLSKAFGHPVLISKVEGGYFPPTLRISGLSVLKSDDQRYLQMDRADAKLPWSALWGKSATPSQLSVQGFQITLSRRADGSWDTEEWLPALSGSSTAARTSIPMDLRGGQIRWVDAYAPVPAELTATGVEGRLESAALKLKGELANGVATAFQLETQGVWGNREGSGELRFGEGGRSIAFRVERQAGQFKCDVESTEWRLDQLWALARFGLRLRKEDATPSGSPYLRNLKAQYTVAAGTTTFASTAGLDQGSMELKGSVHPLAGRPVIRLGVALQNVPVTSLFPVVGSVVSGMDGKITGLLSDFEMTVSSQSWQTAKGTLTLESRDGFYRLPSASLQYLQRAKTAAYLRKKFPDLAGKGLPVLKATLNGRIENGGVTIRSAGLVAGSVRAGFSGRLESVARSLEGYVEVLIQERNAALRRELPSRYIYGETGEKVQPIYGRVQGNWAEWKLRSTSKSRIPGAAQRGVREGSSSVSR